MGVPGRKVAVVGMGGVFPGCENLGAFNEKMFTGKSLIREWPAAAVYHKQIRSVVSGYITEEESGLEATYPVSPSDAILHPLYRQHSLTPLYNLIDEVLKQHHKQLSCHS